MISPAVAKSPKKFCNKLKNEVYSYIFPVDKANHADLDENLQQDRTISRSDAIEKIIITEYSNVYQFTGETHAKCR